MRRVILHMHMPKTGGTTLDAALDRSFGPGHRNMSYLVQRGAAGRPIRHMTWDEAVRMRDAPGVEAEWSLSSPDVVGMLDADDGIVSLSRHGMYVDPACIRGDPGCPGGCRGYDLRPIFFVREFFSWHVSLYLQQRRDPAGLARFSRDPRAVLAKTGSLEEYTRFCVDNADMLRNHKIMHSWTDGETDAVLRSLGLYQIGLTERYDESLVAIEDALSADFPGIDLSYPRPLNEAGGLPGGGERYGAAYLEREVGGASRASWRRRTRSAGCTTGSRPNWRRGCRACGTLGKSSAALGRAAPRGARKRRPRPRRRGRGAGRARVPRRARSSIGLPCANGAARPGTRPPNGSPVRPTAAGEGRGEGHANTRDPAAGPPRAQGA